MSGQLIKEGSNFLSRSSQIEFFIDIKTSLGEHVGLVGSVPELGNWDISKAIYLKTTPSTYPIWRTERPVFFQRKTIFQFKFIVVDDNRQLKRWEFIPKNENRTSKARYFKVALHCTEGDKHQLEEIIQKYEESFSEDIVARDRGKIVEDSNKPKTAFDMSLDVIDPFAIAANYDSTDSIDRMQKKSKLPFKSKEFVSKKKPVKNEKETDEIQDMFFEMIRSGEYQRAHQTSPLNKKEGNFLFLESCTSSFTNLMNLEETNDKPSISLIFSLFLPIRVDLESGELVPEEEIDFAYHLYYEMQEMDEAFKYLWIGGLKQEVPKEKEEMVKKALMAVSCHPVFFSNEFREKYIQNFLPSVYIRGFEGDIHTAEEFNEQNLENLQNALFSNFIKPIQRLLETEKDPMILILGAHMLLLPRMIKRALNEKSIKIKRMVSFVSECFPAHTITKVIPCFSKTVLHSMLKCTLIVFEKHSHAKNFFALVKKSFGLDFTSINGGLCIENFHNRVAVHIKNIGISLRLIRELVRKNEEASRSPTKQVQIPEIFSKGGLDDPGESTLLPEYKGIERDIGVFSVILPDQQLHKAPLSGVEIREAKFSTDKEDKLLYVLQDCVFSKLKLKSIFELLGMLCGYLRDKKIKGRILVILSMKAGAGATWPMAAQAVDSLNAKHAKDEIQVEITQEESLSIANFSSILSQCFLYILLGTGKMYPSLFIFLYIHVNKEPKCGVAMHTCQINEFLKSITPVNPLMIVDVMRAIETASDVPNCRKFFAWNSDKMYVTQHTSKEWLKSIIKYSMKSQSKNLNKLSRLNHDLLRKKYESSKHRLIIFNYEGVLVDPNSFSYVATNGNQMSRISSPMTDQIKRILKELIKDTKNSLFLLTGKKKDSLEHWIGDLKGIGLAVEYGYFYKLDVMEPQWRHLCNMNWSWMETVKNIMVHYVARTDGSYIEYKSSGIVWRFVEREDDYGKNQAIILADHLKSILQPVAANDIEVYIGNSYVEVRPMSLNKGTFVELLIQYLTKKQGKFDFVMALGSSTSDEDVFKTLKAHSEQEQKVTLTQDCSIFTITIGKRPTQALYYLENLKEVQKTLATLAFTEDEELLPCPMETPKVQDELKDYYKEFLSRKAK